MKSEPGASCWETLVGSMIGDLLYNPICCQ